MILTHVSTTSSEHLTDDDFELYAHQRTSPQQDSDFVAHLSVCHDCKDRLLEAYLAAPRTRVRGDREAPRASEERRRNPRIPLRERASLTRLNPLMMDRWPIQVVDISKGGLKLLIPEALERGTIVQIRLRAALVTAEVRYCTGGGSEFQAGVRTLDVFFMARDRDFNGNAGRV